MSDPIYRLETFGKLELKGPASAGLSHQRRRLALLALLAASGDRGMSRDQLLGYLWPESSSANGRHSLEQLLHGIRRALGESVFKGVNPISLNPDFVASDVSEFDRALDQGDSGRAVGLVSGPFLHGFYLEEAPEFERWTSTERDRIGRRYVEALERLACDAERLGDHESAVRWRRRLVDVDPMGSRSSLALMRALAASGDRTAALQHARIYEALVQQELESPPDPSIVAYAAALRAGTDHNVPSSPKPSSEISDSHLSSEPIEPTIAAGSSVRSLDVSETHRSRSRVFWLTGIALAVLVVVGGGVALRSRQTAPSISQNKIVIVPFRITSSDSSVKYLREGAVDLISPMLTGEGGPAAVDSRTAISTWNRVTRGRDGTADDAKRVARELGAGLVLTGSIVEAAGRLTITGTVISGDDDARALTSVNGPADSVDILLGRFVGQLLARQSGVPEMSLAAITSQSFPAVRAYLSGRAAYRRGEDAAAVGSFARALDMDSTFALAALDLAVATGKLLRTKICRNTTCRVYSILPGLPSSEFDEDLFNRAVKLAWENQSKLGLRDRLLLNALRGSNYPGENTARETLANLSAAIRAAPDRPETHYLLGTLLLFQGPALGMTDSREQAESAFRTASRLDSTYLAPLARIVEVAAFQNDTSKVRRAAAVYLSRNGEGSTADFVRWLAAAATGDSATLRGIRLHFASLSRPTLENIFLVSQVTGFGVDDAEAALALIIELSNDPLEKSINFRRAELFALNRGRPAAATARLRSLDELRLSGYTFRQFAVGSSLFTDGEKTVGDSSARDLARSLAADTLGVHTADDVRRISSAMSIEALWYMAHDDTAHAYALTRWMRATEKGQPRNRVLNMLPQMARESRAHSAEGARLRAFVDSVLREGCCALPDFIPVLLAEAYEQSGDDANALRVARQGLWYYPPRQLSRLLHDEGRLAARTGDRAGAIRAYEHYLALRSEPEPGLLPERDRIRAELARLKSLH